MSNNFIDPALRASSNSLSTTPHTNVISPTNPQSHYPPLESATLQPDNYPGTPQSGYNTIEHDGQDGEEGGANDPKRSRACEACRGLKVKCEPDPNNLEGPCKRCAKANRACVVTAPSRKRQKKTDNRVAELEKKIDALTASLHAKENGVALEHGGMTTQNHIPYQQVTNGVYGTPFTGRPTIESRISNEWANGYNKPGDQPLRRPSAPPMVVAGQKRKHIDSRGSLTPDAGSPPVPGQGRRGCSAAGYGLTNIPSGSSSKAEKPKQTHEYADVVDRGLVTSEMATSMFNHYVERMCIHMPAVVFPPGTTAAEIRKTKPTLFLAILSASSGMNYPELQRMLTKELMSIYAERIICNGEKTLEIIQALHVSTLWYWPPEHFEELKFYQLIHISAVMAIDIGIGKKSKSSKSKSAGLWRDHPWRKTPYPDAESIEARRAWLSCYFLCCNAAMGLRRPNLIRWSPFMNECLEVLETSPLAAHSDKTLCQWVRSQQIVEEVGTRFSMDEPEANVSISDPGIEYALERFEGDLERWRRNIPASVRSADLEMTEHVVNLYIHEVAMQFDRKGEDPKATSSIASNETSRGRASNELPMALTSAHISAISTCLRSLDGIFETFLRYDVETVRCLPVAHFVRVAYAVVVLIKMYLAATTPHSELGKIIDKDNMKVEYYLDGLVAIFKASARQEKSRPSAKFLMVLIMLKTWFHRQRDTNKPPETAILATTPPEMSNESNQNGQQRHTPLDRYSPASSSLQLLSEVATGASGRPGIINNYPSFPHEWRQRQPTSDFDPAPNQNAPAAFGNESVGDTEPSNDLASTVGDGFEQAMGITFGSGEFSAYFNDDTFFGSLMDSVGGASGFEGW